MCTVLFYFSVLIHVNIHDDVYIVEPSGEASGHHFQSGHFLWLNGVILEGFPPEYNPEMQGLHVCVCMLCVQWRRRGCLLSLV